MELTTYLSQVIGLFLIIAGLAIMVRKCHYIPLVSGFAEERFSRMILGILELLAGLFLTLALIGSVGVSATILTFIGWLLIIEGSLYLVLSDKTVKDMIRVINIPAWYYVGGVAAVLLGGYLAGLGFGLI